MRDQSDMCFITFVTNHGVERASNALFQSNKYWFIRINWTFEYVNLQKSPVWKLKSPPKSRKSQNRTKTHEIAPWGAISHTLKTTGLDQLFRYVYVAHPVIR